MSVAYLSVPALWKTILTIPTDEKVGPVEIECIGAKTEIIHAQQKNGEWHGLLEVLQKMDQRWGPVTATNKWTWRKVQFSWRNFCGFGLPFAMPKIPFPQILLLRIATKP